MEGCGVTVARLISVDHHRPEVANRRTSERRSRPVANGLVRSSIPLLGAPPVGERESHVATPAPAPVPDSLDRYARIIFPVPPPLR